MVEELRVPITVVVSLTPLPQAAGSTLQVERVTITPSLPTDDPLLHHIALVLQAAIEGESVAGQPSAQSLADALVTPFLRRYGVTRQSPGEVTAVDSRGQASCGETIRLYQGPIVSKDLIPGTLARHDKCSASSSCSMISAGGGLYSWWTIILSAIDATPCACYRIWRSGRGARLSLRLSTEASLDLVEHPELLSAMPEAWFNLVFCGIETLSLEALLTMKKRQNTRKADDGYEEHYLLHAVRKIQEQGIEVAAGFILGADGDTEGSFDAHIEFVQTAGVVMAMEGLLTVLKETGLYKRLEQEGRLLEESTGNNVSTTLNFIPQLERETLIAGYKRVLSTLYDPTLKNYFERCWVLIQHLPSANYRVRRVGRREIKAFLKTLWRQLLSRQGVAYTRFLPECCGIGSRCFPKQSDLPSRAIISRK